MAKIVTKFKYLKPDRKQSAGGYAKYIATREGVEKIDDSKQFAPATVKQQELIKKLLKDFPDSADSLEYHDYLAQHNVATASEFITRTVEDNSYEIAGRESYAKYIATRPRVEKFGRHGLFTDKGVPVQLTKVQEELNKHEGNIWTAIISLRREDAERLDYNNGARWRDMLRSQTIAMAKNMKISIKNLRWYAAFHNESHHPHVHLILYSTDPDEGYLTERGIENLRSSFAREIFAQDLVSIYAKQTESRDKLRANSKTIVEEIISQINSGEYDNPAVEKLLRQLSDKLSRVSGKKQYGYLKADVKDIVDNIIIELSKDERISKLYDLWYEQREEVLRTYTDTLPKRIPLVDNDTFKPIKNHVIKEALKIESGSLCDEEFDVLEESTVSFLETVPGEPLVDTEKTEYDFDLEYLKAAAENGNTWAMYCLGKELFLGENLPKEISQGFDWLVKAMNSGNQYAKYLLAKEYLSGENIPHYPDIAVHLLEELSADNFECAEYRLGKLYYQGGDASQDISKAVYHLERAFAVGNQFAAYQLGKIYLNELQDTDKAIFYLKAAAEEGNPYAQYQLGKLYLYGNGVEKDVALAYEYLIESAKNGNPYALQLLNSHRKGRGASVAMCSMSLLHHLSRIIQNQIEQNRRRRKVKTDRKTRQKIDDKKFGLGLH
ncbi:MAG: MobP3 family relaxase [Ruminococcus sp.]|nr:MobP3 family relaxase [Ruminococcus sp.]